MQRLRGMTPRMLRGQHMAAARKVKTMKETNGEANRVLGYTLSLEQLQQVSGGTFCGDSIDTTPRSDNDPEEEEEEEGGDPIDP